MRALLIDELNFDTFWRILLARLRYGRFRVLYIDSPWTPSAGRIRFLKWLVEIQRFEQPLFYKNDEMGVGLYFKAVRTELPWKFFEKLLEEVRCEDRYFGLYTLKAECLELDSKKRTNSWYFVRMLLLLEWARLQAVEGRPVQLLLEMRPFRRGFRRFIKEHYAQLKVDLYHPVLSTDFSKKNEGIFLFFKLILVWLRTFAYRIVGLNKRMGASSRPLCIEFNGNLNGSYPERQSDLPALKGSALFSRSLLCYSGNWFRFTSDQDRELRELLLAPILRSPEATEVPGVAAFVPRFIRPRVSLRCRGGFSNRQRFNSEKAYWAAFLQESKTRIYYSWHRFTQEHIALSAACRESDALSVFQQRSIENVALIQTLTAVDVMLGFSKLQYELLSKKFSYIGCHVSVGYLGDHRFELLKHQAAILRRKLQESGAQKVLAYVDNNSVDDSVWVAGHKNIRENYEFLCRKVLDEKDVGLILKTKDPLHLSRRLGSVAKLAEQAEATGRCIMIGKGLRTSHFVPAYAGLAADFAVHCQMVAGNAALDCRLAGVPTVMLDQERSRSSPIRTEGIGRFVFDDWVSLWKAAEKYWSREEPQFGDWGQFLNQYDPYRDGKAIYRAEEFLSYLVSGFDRGKSRRGALEFAIERFRSRWGDDKVIYDGLIEE